MPVFSCLKPLNLSSLVKSCIHSTFLKCFQNKQLCCGSVRIPNFLLFESHGDVLRCFSLTLKYLEHFLMSSVGSIFLLFYCLYKDWRNSWVWASMRAEWWQSLAGHSPLGIVLPSGAMQSSLFWVRRQKKGNIWLSSTTYCPVKGF